MASRSAAAAARAADPYASEPKSTAAGAALAFAAVVRLAEIVLGAYIAYSFWQDDHSQRAFLLAGLIGISSVCEGVLSGVRQAGDEKAHNPAASLVLGALHLQPLVEAHDSYASGTKTGCLKLLQKTGAAVYSLPSAFMLAYLAFEHEWYGDWTWAVGLSCLNMTLVLLSAEKELYIEQGLGKLRLFSTYSVVLFCYRAVEIPARVLTLSLFAAQFSYYVFAVIGADLLILSLVRESSERRRIAKAHRSREALTRSLSRLGKSVDDVRDLGLIDDDDLKKEPLSGFSLFAHYGVWVLVFWDGIDAIPFLILRLLESSIIVAVMQIFGDLDDYEKAPLIVTLLFFGVFFLFAPVWHFFRSHATFLHPTFRTPTSVQLAQMKSANRDPDASLERYYDGPADEEAPEPAAPAAAKAATPRRQQQRRESTSESSVLSESESESASETEAGGDDADDGDMHARAMEQTSGAAPVKQLPPPPRKLATSSSQYNWEGHFVDEAMATAEPVAAAPATAAKGDDDGCTVM